MFYLYRKSIYSSKWELIGKFNKEDIERYMDENDGDDIIFKVSLVELDI